MLLLVKLARSSCPSVQSMIWRLLVVDSIRPPTWTARIRGASATNAVAGVTCTEAMKADIEKAFAGYRVDRPMMQHAAPDALFLHCLPAYRGKEVTADVLDAPDSVVWDEAENRLHAQKALLEFLLHR